MHAGEFIFQCPIFLLFHTVHGILKASLLKWLAIPFCSGPHFVRTLHHDPYVLGGPTQHGLLSFTELDKAVVHVIRLASFLWLWFQSALWCLLAPTILVGFLSPWTWGISSWLLQQSAMHCNSQIFPLKKVCSKIRKQAGVITGITKNPLSSVTQVIWVTLLLTIYLTPNQKCIHWSGESFSVIFMSRSSVWILFL